MQITSDDRITCLGNLTQSLYFGSFSKTQSQAHLCVGHGLKRAGAVTGYQLLVAVACRGTLHTLFLSKL